MFVIVLIAYPALMAPFSMRSTHYHIQMSIFQGLELSNSSLPEITAELLRLAGSD